MLGRNRKGNQRWLVMQLSSHARYPTHLLLRSGQRSCHRGICRSLLPPLLCTPLGTAWLLCPAAQQCRQCATQRSRQR